MTVSVPFFRPALSEVEIEAVVRCLRSGWLTTGQVTRDFEERFAAYVGAKYAVAVNSCTAALHLALEALGLQRGEMVLVPTLTFAATAEVVRYFDAVPVFVDSEPLSLCMDPDALEYTLRALHEQRPVAGLNPPYGKVRAVIPVHYAGQMADVSRIREIASRFDALIVEDAAHTLPAFERAAPNQPWSSVGHGALVTCFSFYANKCITTGEGGMATTDRPELAERMRIMSLHGMSRDAWKRFTAEGSWYYEIVAPGFKYNLTDIAAALGVSQLARADELWKARQRIADRYLEGLGDLEELQLPRQLPNRLHSWHLFVVRLNLGKLRIDRAAFIDALSKKGIASSVHWLPLHMHPYYAQTFGYAPEQFPIAQQSWPRLVSLPLFPAMSDAEIDAVVAAVRETLLSARVG